MDGLETKEEDLSEAHDGRDVAVGIKENITVSSSPERWTSSGGRPVREEAGKGKVSVRASVSAKAQKSNRGKSLKICFSPLETAFHQACWFLVSEWVPLTTPIFIFIFIL